ncbi:hypothetical protein CYMTET_2515 [Cymbomonas tetramitiformis]|uniref:Uncharacterized protein n=1 Tax=Cymbomonas tetramitiformis TaxID=36881 RepID=A0AAE0H515_9CHLO|nr:hypothetical protein CYMTET_2515 [Cymbomonas tetramitiformis]
MQLICANGHTICAFCEAEPISATLTHCGICHEPRLNCQIRLPAVFEDMYANLRDQSCPLCTDDKARSVKELLQHVHRCPAVGAVEEIRTDKFALMATRERWEKQACASLGRPEFIAAIKEHVEKLIAFERRELDEEISRLNSKVRDYATLNSELEYDRADLNKLIAELQAANCELRKRVLEGRPDVDGDSERGSEKAKRSRREEARAALEV